MDIKTIRIAEWNANGLLHHKPELIQFPQTTKLMYYSYQKHTVLLEQCSKYPTTQSTTVTTRMALPKEMQQYSILQHYNIMKLPLIKQTKYKLLLSKLKHNHGLLT